MIKKAMFCTALLLPLASPAFAMTEAAQIKPILTATKSNWVAVREYEGQDLLYFTHLEVWRCGLDGLTYRINDGDEEIRELETCYEGEAAPGAMKDESRLPFITLPLGSVTSVTIILHYDDGTTDEATFERKAIQIP